MATKKPLGQGCVAVAGTGEGPGGPSLLFLDQTEAQRAENNLGADQALPPYFNVWIRHCVALVEEDKVVEQFVTKK